MLKELKLQFDHIGRMGVMRAPCVWWGQRSKRELNLYLPSCKETPNFTQTKEQDKSIFFRKLDVNTKASAERVERVWGFFPEEVEKNERGLIFTAKPILLFKS